MYCLVMCASNTHTFPEAQIVERGKNITKLNTSFLCAQQLTSVPRMKPIQVVKRTTCQRKFLVVAWWPICLQLNFSVLPLVESLHFTKCVEVLSFGHWWQPLPLPFCLIQPPLSVTTITGALRSHCLKTSTPPTDLNLTLLVISWSWIPEAVTQRMKSS